MHEKIRQAILERMKEKGISYADLENMTGVSRSSIQRYVVGKTSKIPYDRIIIILQSLAIDPRDFALYAPDSKTADTFLGMDDDTLRLAEELRTSPGMRLLFDATKNCTEEDMRRVAAMIKAYKGEND